MERVLLLVDDEANILSALVRAFRRDGYRILTAESAMLALEILEKEPVGVILSDQRMPNMTGAQLFEEAKHRWPQTMRIILSGHAELVSILDAINQGAVHKFLTKPWEDDLLRAQVRAAFEHHELLNERDWLLSALQRAQDAQARLSAQIESNYGEKIRSLQDRLKKAEPALAALDDLPCAIELCDPTGHAWWRNTMAKTQPIEHAEHTQSWSTESGQRGTWKLQWRR